jgi:DegV family protein with EDD domain
VSVHISSKLSGTISSAQTAAREFAGRVHVVDTLNLSWGQGFQVLEAARAAASGLGAEAIVERVHSARERVQMIVALDSLDNLVKGGRIGKLAGAIGGMLNVKITITPRDGELVVVRPLRGARSALDFTVKWVEEKMAGAPGGVFCVMHAMSEDRAQWLRDAIEQRFHPTELYVVAVGPVIATHTGTGWGVAFLPDE